ncbi:MAG: DUF2281 domain-containing protein [Oscillatoria sp. SIO1A7]|nr:DUF2281 domain-containing protein [Oscillatoria sp. SIO1A7]
MELEKTWQKLAILSPEAQREVAEFIALLKQRDRFSEQTAATEQTPWRSQPFIGMWKDRTDLEDSSQWVRSARQKEWRS